MALRTRGIYRHALELNDKGITPAVDKDGSVDDAFSAYTASVLGMYLPSGRSKT